MHEAAVSHSSIGRIHLLDGDAKAALASFQSGYELMVKAANLYG